MRYLLGIDLGTSSVRSIVLSENGEVLAISQKEYSFEIPNPGWAEQNPEDWWQATVHSIKEVISRVNPQCIVAIGFSGQMHSLVPLDESGNPVRNSIIWCDKRSQTQVDEINERCGADRISNICHSPVGTGFLLSSLLWMKENESIKFKSISHVLLAKDYIRYRLTNKFCTEITDAAGTLAFDVEKENWSDELLSLLDIPSSIFPERIGTPTEISGYVTREAAAITGLKEGLPCVFGGADQVMQAVGNGIVKSGVVSVTVGTGGQLLSVLETPIIDHGLSSHCFNFLFRKSWYFLGASLNGGYTLKWMKNILGDLENYSQIDEIVKNIPEGSGNLIFLPYLNGERTPYMDSKASGILFGLEDYHTRAHIYRAVMEGIMFAMKDCLFVLQNIVSTKFDFIIASGGASSSSVWLQIEADIFNKKVYVSDMKEQASIGAALCAGVGAGVYPNIDEACKRVVRIKPEPILPRVESVKKYENYYVIYKQLYKANKDIMHSLSSLHDGLVVVNPTRTECPQGRTGI